MAWVAVAGAVVGTVGSALVNRGANNAAANASNTAADATAQQTQIAKDQYADWRRDFLPLQGELAARARTIGSPEEQERQAELARGDVGIAYGRARSDLSNRLTSYGIDPSSSKYATTFGRFGLGEAAAGAGAANKARTDLVNKADAFKLDFYNAGKGTPSSSMAALGSAAGANMGAASMYQNQASRNAAGIGSFVQKLTPAVQNWWSKPPSVPSVDPYEVDGM